MKIKKTAKQEKAPVKKRFEAQIEGSYTHTFAKFQTLTVLDFEMLERKGMAFKFPTVQRSYLSKHAGKIGWGYKTFTIPGTDESWLVRIEL